MAMSFAGCEEYYFQGKDFRCLGLHGNTADSATSHTGVFKNRSVKQP